MLSHVDIRRKVSIHRVSHSVMHKRELTSRARVASYSPETSPNVTCTAFPWKRACLRVRVQGLQRTRGPTQREQMAPHSLDTSTEATGVRHGSAHTYTRRPAAAYTLHTHGRDNHICEHSCVPQTVGCTSLPPARSCAIRVHDWWHCRAGRGALTVLQRSPGWPPACRRGAACPRTCTSPGPTPVQYPEMLDGLRLSPGNSCMCTMLRVSEMYANADMCDAVPQPCRRWLGRAACLEGAVCRAGEQEAAPQHAHAQHAARVARQLVLLRCHCLHGGGRRSGSGCATRCGAPALLWRAIEAAVLAAAALARTVWERNICIAACVQEMPCCQTHMTGESRYCEA